MNVHQEVDQLFMRWEGDIIKSNLLNFIMDLLIVSRSSQKLGNVEFSIYRAPDDSLTLQATESIKDWDEDAIALDLAKKMEDNGLVFQYGRVQA